jgi:hypothetical protein
LFVNVFVLKIGKRLENETLKKREEKDILIDQHAPTFLFYLSLFSFFFFFFFFPFNIWGSRIFTIPNVLPCRISQS